METYKLIKRLCDYFYFVGFFIKKYLLRKYPPKTDDIMPIGGYSEVIYAKWTDDLKKYLTADL